MAAAAGSNCKNDNNNNTCRDVFEYPTKLPPSSPLTYFFSISISQPKVRIKIPKVLVKTIKRRRRPSSSSSEEKSFKDDHNNFKKRVGRIFSSVFGRKKSSEEEEAQMLKKDETSESEEGNNKKRRQQYLSFKRLFNKRNGIGVRLFRGNPSGGVRTRRSAIVIGRQKSSRGLVRVPSRILTTRQRLKMTRNKCEENGVVKVDELCKKRILMGEKCRPLNHSGKLQYDQDGVLLPEFMP